MRIGTWNLERGGRTRAARRAQEEALREFERDVLVITEPGPSFAATLGVVTSPRLRRNRSGAESWVAILGSAVRPASLEIPFERMAVAAVMEASRGAFVIYGSVLPWRTFRQHAPELAHESESSVESFVRVLRDQVADIEYLRRRHPAHAVRARYTRVFGFGSAWRLSPEVSSQMRAAMLFALSTFTETPPRNVASSASWHAEVPFEPISSHSAIDPAPTRFSSDASRARHLVAPSEKHAPLVRARARVKETLIGGSRAPSNRALSRHVDMSTRCAKQASPRAPSSPFRRHRAA